MGKGSGTGSPNFFQCGAYRRENYRTRRGLDYRREHTVKLTGRTKPYNPPRALGSRSTFTSYEYECTCGHVGWSNHIELAAMAGDEEALRRTGRSS